MTERKLVPKRRFTEFNEEWKDHKLEDLVEDFEYGLNASSASFDGINKYIRITDIDDETRVFLQSDLTSPSTNLNNADNYLLKKGDILFARTGASVGKTYCYDDKDGKVYYAGFLIRARTKSVFDAGFIFQNTLTNEYKNFVRVTSQRSGQPGINAQEYAGFSLKVPAKYEQQKISEFFKQLDQMITLEQRKLEKTKALKSAYLAEMFPAEGERVPERRFGKFEDKWILRELGEVANFFNNMRIPIDTQKRIKGNYPYYGATGVIDYVKDYIFEGEYILLAEDGENILSRNNAIAYLTKGKFWVNNHAHVMNMRAGSNLFLLQLLEKQEYKKYNSGTAQPKLNGERVKSMKFYFPSVQEQQAIGEFFKKLDDSITNQQQKLDKLKAIKQAYLQEMFV